MFGQPEVLVAAIHLAALPGIFVDDTLDDITYYHLIFDHHEVILAEGAPSESLFPGPEALKTIGAAAQAELKALFPDMLRALSPAASARPIPQARRQKRLVARHHRNGKPMLEGLTPPRRM